LAWVTAEFPVLTDEQMASVARRGTRHSEVLGVVPLEVTDALLEEFRRLADRHERGLLVE
jgi:hypothetical protein